MVLFSFYKLVLKFWFKSLSNISSSITISETLIPETLVNDFIPPLLGELNDPNLNESLPVTDDWYRDASGISHPYFTYI